NSLREILALVLFVQNDDRMGARLPTLSQIPLQASQVEVAIEPGDKKCRIDIGGDHLLLKALACRFTYEAAPALQYGMQHRAILVAWNLRSYPIADRRPIGVDIGAFAQLARRRRPTFAEFAGNAPKTTLL